MALTVHRLIRNVVCGPLLALLITLAQLGGITHEISHLHDDLAQTQDGKQGVPSKVCDQCLAFSQIFSAIVSTSATLAPLAFLHVVPRALALHWIALDAPTARSRGPPQII